MNLAISRVRRPRCAPTICALVLFAATMTPANAEDWPQFRGPAGDGSVAGTGAFEGDRPIVLEAAWRVPIGSGYSGLAVAAGKLVTMFSSAEADVMAAFDARSGKELWRFAIEPAYAGHDGSHDGPLSTPLIAGNLAIGLGARGRFFAVELDSGRLVWSRNLPDELDAGEPFYGFATSPIFVDGIDGADGVVVLQPGSPGGTVAGFDPATGELRWSAGDDGVAAQTPAPWPLPGGTQVVASGMKQAFGLDPYTGNVLWRFEHDGGGGRGATSMTPVPSGGSRLLLAHKDGASTVVEVERAAGETQATAVWESRAIRNSYNVPVYHDGLLYAFSSRFLTAVDPATGEPEWRSRAPGDGFLIVVDEHLVILTKEGTLHVAVAGPGGYDERAGLALFDDLAWTHPTFADGAIFARSLGRLARVDIRRGEVATRLPGADRNALAGTRFAAFLEEARRAPSPQALVNERFRQLAGGDTPIVEDDWVHFVYRGHGDDVAVAGDMFGARQERRMERLAGADLFHYSMRLEPDARLNYLFIDEWEALPDPRNSRDTTTSVLGEDMEMAFRGQMKMSWFAMPAWTAPAHLAPAASDRRGSLDAHDWDSAALGRSVRVSIYLPAGYATGERRFPVVYVHDGRAARLRGDWPNSLDNLMGDRVAALIAVFVRTTPGRNLDGYAAMVADELVPWVDATYRTRAAPEARAHVGSGRGAFTAFYCAFERPEIARRVGAQSLFMFDANRAQLEPLIDTADRLPLDIYLEWGRYDLRNPHEAWDIGRISRDFADQLRARGYDPAGGEVHDGTGWSSWRNRTDVLLETLFPIEPPTATPTER